MTIYGAVDQSVDPSNCFFILSQGKNNEYHLKGLSKEGWLHRRAHKKPGEIYDLSKIVAIYNRCRLMAYQPIQLVYRLRSACQRHHQHQNRLLKYLFKTECAMLKELTTDESAAIATKLVALAQNAEELDLSHLNLTALPANLSQCKRLKKLTLSGNPLLSDLSALKDLPLEELNLYAMGCKSLPKGLSGCKRLKRLDLSFNSHLVDLDPKELRGLTHLEELDLSGTGLKTLPPAISSLTHLRMLELSATEIQTINAIGSLKRLEDLSMMGTPLKAVPSAIGKCQALKKVNLTSCQLTDLPDAFGNLKRLERLEICNNPFKQIPTAIFSLHSLQHLDLSGCYLALDEDAIQRFKSLKKLTHLDLDHFSASHHLLLQRDHSGCKITSSHWGELPKAEFEVDEAHDLLQIAAKKRAARETTIQKICRYVWNFFSVLIPPIGIGRLIGRLLKGICNFAIVPASVFLNKKWEKKDLKIQELNASREWFMRQHGERAAQATLKTADGVKLDSLLITHAKPNALPYAQQKWVVCFHPNAGCYESSLNELMKISDDLEINVLTGNYHGVMRSEGYGVSCSDDLIRDGEAMVQYLLSLGVQPENIQLQGLSLGGAVATAIGGLHPGMHLFADRTFSNLTEVIRGWMPRGLKWLGTLAGKITVLSGWHFDSVKSYHAVKGLKCTVHSKEDGVISYSASLYKGIKESRMSAQDKQLKKQRLKLKKKARGKDHPQGYKPEHVIKLQLVKDEFPKDFHRVWGAVNHCYPLTDQYVGTPSLVRGYTDYLKFTKHALKLNSSLAVPTSSKSFWDRLFKYWSLD